MQGSTYSDEGIQEKVGKLIANSLPIEEVSHFVHLLMSGRTTPLFVAIMVAVGDAARRDGFAANAGLGPKFYGKDVVEVPPPHFPFDDYTWNDTRSGMVRGTHHIAHFDNHLAGPCYLGKALWDAKHNRWIRDGETVTQTVSHWAFVKGDGPAVAKSVDKHPASVTAQFVLGAPNTSNVPSDIELGVQMATERAPGEHWNTWGVDPIPYDQRVELKWPIAGSAGYLYTRGHWDSEASTMVFEDNWANAKGPPSHWRFLQKK